MGQKCCASDVRRVESLSEVDGDAPTVLAPDTALQEVKKISSELVAVDDATCAAQPPVCNLQHIQSPEPVIDLNHPLVDVEAPFDERDRVLVQHTWGNVAVAGTEQVGTMLFEKIFELAPAAKQLFPFSFERGSGRPDMLRHVTKVVSTLAIAVKGLHDLDALKPTLQALGLRHVGYKVLPEHYDVVCEALHQTLSSYLHDDFTPSVKASWEKVLRFVREAMIGDYYTVGLPVSAGPEDEVAAPKPEHAEPAEVPPVREPEETKSEEKVSTPAAEVELPPPPLPPPAEAPVPKATKESKSGKTSRSSSRPPETKKAGKEKDKSAKKTKSKPQAEQAAASKASPSASPSASPPGSQAATPKSSPSTKPKKMSNKERDKFWKSLSEKERATQSRAMAQAALAGNLTEVKRHYDAFVDVNAEDPDGRTPLRNASRAGAKDVVEFLVETAGAELDRARPNALGAETALHLACQFSKYDVVIYLAKAGASCSLKNKAGKTPAELTKNPELAAWLSGPSSPKDTEPPAV